VTGKNLRLALFIVLAVIQLTVAAGAIIRSEMALRYGEVFRFKLQPVDPVDAFRGRHVALRFAADRAPVAEGLPHLNRQKVFVPLTVDDEGFAGFGPVVLEPPATGSYLRLRSGVDFTDENGDRRLSLALPFRRYYMTEELARDVDRSLWRRGLRPAWAVVRVRSGTGVIEDLFVDGVPVREWLATGGPESPPTAEP
jgi:uncharacterized membrane-anchored protein